MTDTFQQKLTEISQDLCKTPMKANLMLPEAQPFCFIAWDMVAVFHLSRTSLSGQLQQIIKCSIISYVRLHNMCVEF